MGRILNQTLYPPEEPIISTDYVIGTETVTPQRLTKNFTMGAIAQYMGTMLGVTVDPNNQLISIDDAYITNLDLYVEGVRWIAEGQEFYVESQTLFLSTGTPGQVRTDILVGTTEGTLVIYSGIEDPNTAVPPILPPKTVPILVINQFIDGTYSPPEVPQPTDYMLKSDEAQQLFDLGGEVPYIVWNNRNTYRWVKPRDTSLVLSGMLSVLQIYDGRSLTIINSGGQDMTLKHNINTDIATPFYFQTGQDLVLKPNHIVVFKYTIINNRLEFESISQGSASASQVSYNNPQYNNVQAALDALLYVAPQITNFTNTVGTVEKGTVVNSVVLNWGLNKTMNTLFLNNSIGALSPTATTYTHTGQNITTNRVYTLTASDGQNTVSANTSVNFLNKRYWGNSAATSLNSAGILALQGSELSGTRAQTKNIEGQGNYIYLAYPVSFGQPMIKVNGLEFTAYSLNTVSFTNSLGFTEPYYVIRTNTIQNGELLVQVT